MMKIKLSDKATKEFFDEFLNVTCCYEKIKKDPTKKIVPYTKEIIKYMLMIFFLNILLLCAFLILKDKIIMVGFLIDFILMIIMFCYLLLVNSKLNKLLNGDKMGEIELDKTKVLLNTFNGQSVRFNWTALEAIVIYKYGFYLVPKDMKGIILAIGIEDQKKFFNYINKNKIKVKIVDNSKLYK